MPMLRTLLTDVRWSYPRPVTTVAVAAAATGTAAVVRGLAPQAWRSPGTAPLVLAAAGGYAAIRLGAYTGWTKRFKHDVVDRLGGDVDDFPTYLVAALGSGGVLALVGLTRRAAGRSGARPPAPGRVARGPAPGR